MRFEDLEVWKRATTILNNFHIRHSGLEPESRNFKLDSCFRRNDKKI